MAKVETFHGHEHPTLDVALLEHEVLVADDGFEVRVEEFEDEVQVRLVAEHVQELRGVSSSVSLLSLTVQLVGVRASITLGWRNSRRNLTSRMADMSRPSLNWPTLICGRARWSVSLDPSPNSPRCPCLFDCDFAVRVELVTEIDDGVRPFADFLVLGVALLDRQVGCLGRLHLARVRARYAGLWVE